MFLQVLRGNPSKNMNIESEPGPFAASVIGPFPKRSHVVINGHLVPHLSITTIQSSGPDDGMFNLHLDNRWVLSCTQEELDKWADFIANAMAVAGGYTCFGEGSKPRNPFHHPCREIAINPEDD